MKNYKLQKRYFILLYIGLIVLSICMYLYISEILKKDEYYSLYSIILIIFILSIFQYKAKISISDIKITRYTGFRNFGHMEIEFKEIKRVELHKPFTKLIIHTKDNRLMVFSKYFENFKIIGTSIFEYINEKNLDVEFDEKFVSYFLK